MSIRASSVALCACLIVALALSPAFAQQAAADDSTAPAGVHAAPKSCPANCNACVRMRGKKVLSAETVVAANTGREWLLFGFGGGRGGWERHVTLFSRVAFQRLTFTHTLNKTTQAAS